MSPHCLLSLRGDTHLVSSVRCKPGDQSIELGPRALFAWGAAPDRRRSAPGRAGTCSAKGHHAHGALMGMEEE